MSGQIGDDVLIGAINAEVAARSGEFANLLSLINGLGTQISALSFELKQLASYTKKGITFNASALVGQHYLTQIQPGYALAESLLTLQSQINSINGTLTASITNLYQTVATENSAQAVANLQLSATVNQNNILTTASVSQVETATATAIAASASAVATLTATVSGFSTSIATITTDQAVNATAIAANATSITTLTSTVTGQTTSIATINSTLTTNATAISANASAITALSSSVSGSLATINSTLTTDATNISANSTSITTLSSTVAGNAATVTTLAATVATADGHLSANYSITLNVGGQVTGMQLNSSAGGGTTTSSVTFQAGVFAIYNGTTAIAPFTVSGGVVQMANAVVTSSMSVGTGTGALLISGSAGINFGVGDLIIGGAVTGSSIKFVSGSGSYGALQIANPSGVPPSITGFNTAGSTTLSITSAGYGLFSSLVVTNGTINGFAQIVGSDFQIGTSTSNQVDIVTAATSQITIDTGGNLIMHTGAIEQSIRAGWGPYLWDGAKLIQFQYVSGHLYFSVNNGVAVLIV